MKFGWDPEKILDELERRRSLTYQAENFALWPINVIHMTPIKPFLGAELCNTVYVCVWYHKSSVPKRA